ncbi:MAG: hypothetical protein ABI903_16240 [Actinomycetota bacterium]
MTPVTAAPPARPDMEAEQWWAASAGTRPSPTLMAHRESVLVSSQP